MNFHRGPDDRVGLWIILARVRLTGERWAHDIEGSINDATSILAGDSETRGGLAASRSSFCLSGRSEIGRLF
jgi:hypothetical protein